MLCLGTYLNDDYKDWIRCVAKDKEKRNEHFFTITTMKASNVFQLDVSSKNIK
jgi:hypothetical protein